MFLRSTYLHLSNCYKFDKKYVKIQFRRSMSDQTKIKALLIDLSGTLHVDDDPTPNAVIALNRLRSINGIQVRFVTNTTKESNGTLLHRLHGIGFTSITKDDIFSSLSAAAQYTKNHRLRPYYLLTEDAKKDFIDEKEFETTNNLKGDEDSVVVGLAPDKFEYEILNKAFHVLMKDNSTLVAIHEGKYYKRKNDLAVGPGFFTHGLEYATGKSAIVLGKPNSYFFNSAIPEGIAPNECCMIGDDINDDVFGAMNIGIKGILVKTGKYIQNIETKYNNQPTRIVETFADAVELLIKSDFVL